MKQRRDIKERFMSRVEKTDNTGCWLWTGGLFQNTGYGQFNISNGKTHGQPRSAHRVSYELHNGQIPDGHYIDHICRVRRCVNPGHLRAVTPRINSIENSVGPIAINSRKTHCVRGHEFTPENILPVKGGRACRECKKAAFRKWYDNKRRAK